MFLILADLTLICHVAFVIFVVLTVPLIFIGNYLNWHWVKIKWLRIAHLLGIVIVALQAWLGIECPLTILERYLRESAGEVTYAGSFIEYWLQQLLYWQAPSWVFVLVYTVFALVVVSTWFLVPPTKVPRTTASPNKRNSK